jgi:hypothetical protein
MKNPEISGIEYQNGTLFGYEVKEYLLQKWGRKCAYCPAKNTPLEIEHIIPKAKGGSNCVTNLTLAYVPCNQAKGSLNVEEFLKNKPSKLKTLIAAKQKPLRSAATMNILRNKLRRILSETDLPVIESIGAETKFNRKCFGIPKTHALDAAFTGPMSQSLNNWSMITLQIAATGRGSYQRTRTNKYGFPRSILGKTKSVYGFQTGDHVHSPKGARRIAIRSSGHFALKTNSQSTTIKHSLCRRTQRADGYRYSLLIADN